MLAPTQIVETETLLTATLAMTVARAVWSGGYEGLAGAWGELLGRLDASGLRTADDLWERYLVGPEAAASPADYRTELNRPLVA